MELVTEDEVIFCVFCNITSSLLYYAVASGLPYICRWTNRSYMLGLMYILYKCSESMLQPDFTIRLVRLFVELVHIEILLLYEMSCLYKISFLSGPLSVFILFSSFFRSVTLFEQPLS
jgi:hypothetical protein